MYLAPLNFDHFFKKVFSDVRIAKAFLEAFLSVKIESITLVNTVYKMTDSATPIEFDFHCKINGEYVIIDMQQWYKQDVVKRFYLYHSADTALQLENMPKIPFISKTGRKYDIRSYNTLLPVITIIWMVDDNLGFKEDFISFALYPEQTADFVKDESLWENFDIEKIKERRNNILSLLTNKTKGLDFLPQNRLIYAFQNNIINNQMYSEYFEWFDFAEKTRNKKNAKEDFVLYEKKEIFMEIIHRINKESLSPSEIDYSDLGDFETFLQNNEEYRNYIHESVRAEVKAEVKDEVKAELKAEIKESVKEEVKAEIKEESINIGKALGKENTVILAYQKGIDKLLVAAITELSVEKVEEIIEKYKATGSK